MASVMVEVADEAAVGSREGSMGAILAVWCESKEAGKETKTATVVRVVRVAPVQSAETTKRARSVETPVIVRGIMLTRQGGQEGIRLSQAIVYGGGVTWFRLCCVVDGEPDDGAETDDPLFRAVMTCHFHLGF